MRSGLPWPGEYPFTVWSNRELARARDTTDSRRWSPAASTRPGGRPVGDGPEGGATATDRGILVGWAGGAEPLQPASGAIETRARTRNRNRKGLREAGKYFLYKRRASWKYCQGEISGER